MELVIASRNVHKIREFRAILKKLTKFDLLSLIDFPDYIPLAETGLTFEENAKMKAEHAAKSLDRLVLADDSGLVVPALNGAPGIISSRYAGEGATDRENRAKLLKEMAHIPDPYRQAYFECWVILASPKQILKVARGTSEGTIIEQERGSFGFGYDPIFLKHEYSKTFAELDEETKNRISHRRKAIDKILPALETAFESAPDALPR